MTQTNKSKRVFMPCAAANFLYCMLNTLFVFLCIHFESSDRSVFLAPVTTLFFQFLTLIFLGRYYKGLTGSDINRTAMKLVYILTVLCVLVFLIILRIISEKADDSLSKPPVVAVGLALAELFSIDDACSDKFRQKGGVKNFFAEKKENTKEALKNNLGIAVTCIFFNTVTFIILLYFLYNPNTFEKVDFISSMLECSMMIITGLIITAMLIKKKI